MIPNRFGMMVICNGNWQSLITNFDAIVNNLLIVKFSMTYDSYLIIYLKKKPFYNFQLLSITHWCMLSNKAVY